MFHPVANLMRSEASLSSADAVVECSEMLMLSYSEMKVTIPAVTRVKVMNLKRFFVFLGLLMIFPNL